MSRGSGGAILAPQRDGDTDEAANADLRLVAAVRRGDDRAFEVLYQRYQHRIHAYVLGMVKDHGRAEDVTQEVFVSALRRMRATEQPLVFKPWLYQIAKNGCIDAFRRSRRVEEVSWDTPPADLAANHSRLVDSAQSPDAVVAVKQELESLCGAFGGLSETHHEILVLRELEGLSYQEIADRMGISRPAVESTLFRARRRLTEEFDDIVSGARCLRVREIITVAVQSRVGARDTRRLARHLSHCQGCRREALAAGVDRSLISRPSVRERVATKIPGFLPVPAFLRRGGEAAMPPSGRGAGFASQLPMLSDHMASGWSKLAAGVAVLAASVGTGVSVHKVTSPPAPPRPPAQTVAATASSAPGASSGTKSASATTRRTSANAAPAAGAAERAQSKRRSHASAGAGTLANSRAANSPATAGGNDPLTGTGTGTGADASAPAAGDESAASSTPTATPSKPATEKRPETNKRTPVPVPVPTTATDPVKNTTTTVQETARNTTTAVQQTTNRTTETVDNTVERVTGGGPVAETVDQTTDVVDDTVGNLTNTVNNTTQGLTNTLGGLLGGR